MYGKINPSLDLKHLTHLNLSENDFGGIQIPKFLRSLSSLRHLDLNDARIGGMIPHQLANLTSFLYIDDLYAKNLQWLSQLSSLQYLYMRDTNLSELSDWLEVTNTLPSLLELRFLGCFFWYNVPAINHVNFSSLAYLDLFWV